MNPWIAGLVAVGTLAVGAGFVKIVTRASAASAPATFQDTSATPIVRRRVVDSVYRITSYEYFIEGELGRPTFVCSPWGPK